MTAYINRYVGLSKRRLPQFARGTTGWCLEERDFFGLRRQRVWVFWRLLFLTFSQTAGVVERWGRQDAARGQPVTPGR